VAGELLTGGFFMGLVKQGKLYVDYLFPSLFLYNPVRSWRRLRRAGHEAMSKAASTKFFPVQAREALIVTENLLQDSKRWDKEFLR
jgi:hypothetical protein